MTTPWTEGEWSLFLCRRWKHCLSICLYISFIFTYFYPLKIFHIKKRKNCNSIGQSYSYKFNHLPLSRAWRFSEAWSLHCSCWWWWCPSPPWALARQPAHLGKAGQAGRAEMEIVRTLLTMASILHHPIKQWNYMIYWLQLCNTTTTIHTSVVLRLAWPRVSRKHSPQPPPPIYLRDK